MEVSGFDQAPRLSALSGPTEGSPRMLQQAHCAPCVTKVVFRYLLLLFPPPRRTPFIATFSKSVLLPSTPAETMLSVKDFGSLPQAGLIRALPRGGPTPGDISTLPNSLVTSLTALAGCLLPPMPKMKPNCRST